MNTTFLNTVSLDNGKVLIKGGASGGNAGGGESGGVLFDNDVNFIDSDGSLLYAYSKKDFLAMGELPPVPEKEGFISQGWNWSLADAKAFVQDNGVIDIGATYITDDNATRLYISIEHPRHASVNIKFKQSVASGVLVDWGDGKTNRYTSSGSVSGTHTYASPGEYVISLKPTSGTLTLGQESTTACIMGSVNISSNPSQIDNAVLSMLRKIAVGKNCSIAKYALQELPRLECVMLPQSVQSINDDAFKNAIGLKGLVIPNSVTTIGFRFYYMKELERISLPKSITSIADNFLSYSYELKRLVLPNGMSQTPGNMAAQTTFPIIIGKGITKIAIRAFYQNYLRKLALPNSIVSFGTNAFENCYYLNEIIEIPEGVTSIPKSCFSGCSAIVGFRFPKGINNIAQYAFNYCKGAVVYDFRLAEQIPTLEDTTAFNNVASTYSIIVPDALYDEWIAATNWASYSIRFVKASEYTD